LLTRCNQSGSALADRDLYVFVLDRQGHYIAYAGQPAKVGLKLADLLGRAGQQLVDDIWAQAERGPGWVDYSVAHPVSGLAQAKASYVLRLGPQRVLGCGIYKHRIGTPA
jgi:signal transduction histidine kinase